MNVTSKFQSILPSLAEKALTSPINYKLSAGILMVVWLGTIA